VPYECVDILCPRLGGGLTVYAKGHVRKVVNEGSETWMYIPKAVQ
jgi:hypothetical protein